MLNLRRFHVRRCLIAIVAVSLGLLLAFSSALGLRAEGQVEPVVTGNSDIVPSVLIQDVDPNCQLYDRCEESFKSTFGSITIQSLQQRLDSPDVFVVNGTIGFRWIPQAYPGWDPSQLKIDCQSRGCDFPGWTSVSIAEDELSRTWSARFAAHVYESSTLKLYPFDQHWVHLKLSGMDPVSQEFLSYIDVSNYDIEVDRRVLSGSSSNFHVNYGTSSTTLNAHSNDFYAVRGGPRRSTSQSLKNRNASGESSMDKKAVFKSAKPLDSNSFVIAFQVRRRLPAALWMVVIPLALILLNTNLAFHWRENSPASRFGSSGLLTAVSLFFASRVFRPDVGYLVFTDLWFLFAFVVITVNNILLIWLFRYYKHRQVLKSIDPDNVSPAYFAENKLTVFSAVFILIIGLSFLLSSWLMSRPPTIPGEFLAGNSSYAQMGASAIRVYTRTELASDQGGLIPYKP